MPKNAAIPTWRISRESPIFALHDGINSFKMCVAGIRMIPTINDSL